MNYQDARKIRRTGLGSLIVKRAFAGEGFGAIGSSISDKFKAKGKGIQESLDPLNWTRKLTGKGWFGDLAVNAAGRAFGRSNEDIQAFGGVGRNKRKKRNKNPQFTTVSGGPIKPLKMGDSVADILGKMYNFMLKTEQVYKLNDEIAQAFRQEQMDEDEHRHKELVKAILQFTKKSKTYKFAKKDDEGNNINKGIIETIAGTIASWAAELLVKMAKFFAEVARILRVAGLLGPAGDLIAGSRILGNNEPATKTKDQNNKNKKINPQDKIKSKINEVKKETAKKETAKKGKKGKAKKVSGGNSKQNRTARRSAERQRNPAKLTKRAAKNIGDDSNVFYGFDPKANLYFFKELVKNAIDWRNKNKSDYEPYRDEISKMVNGYDEFVAKQPFRADEEFETEIEKLPEYYIDPNSPKKVPEPYLDVNAQPVFFDPLNKVIKEIPGMKEVLKDQQKINQEKNTVIPLSHSEKALGLEKGESVVAVNTKVDNIAKPSKIVSTKPASARDEAIQRQLRGLISPF